MDESPGLLPLFRRSRYRHVRTSEDLPAKERREAERFAVAALAFCLRHDKTLRQSFVFLAIGRMLSITRLEALSIRIEPKRQADLLLTLARDFAAAVEFKINSHLETIQSPGEKLFNEAKGYGHWLRERYRGQALRTLHYVVLDQADWRLTKKSVQVRSEPIRLRHVRWSDLLKMKVANPDLQKDLFHTLENLGIAAMTSWKSKDAIVKTPLRDACIAGHVIEKVIADLQIQRSATCIQNLTNEESDWEFGVYLNPIKGKTRHKKAFQRRLAKICGTGVWAIAWFGYVPDNANAAACAKIWLYTSTVARAKKLLGQLQKRLGGARLNLEPDPENPAIRIAKNTSSKTPDAKWFVETLKAAARGVVH